MMFMQKILQVFLYGCINYSNPKLVISDIIDSASQVDVGSRWTVKVLWRTLLHASVEKWRGTLSYTWCREKCWKVTWKTWGICAVFVLRVNFVDIFACFVWFRFHILKDVCFFCFPQQKIIIFTLCVLDMFIHISGRVFVGWIFPIGYGAWHMFVVVLALASGRFHGDWKMIFLRFLKLPFLWTLGRSNWQKEAPNWAMKSQLFLVV